MIIHFICHGNALRSRMAEAYFKSLHLPNMAAISSGSVAIAHSEANKLNFARTLSLLKRHGLGSYSKSSWDQLTQKRLDSGDVTICLNQSVFNECNQLFTMPEDTAVWDIPDFDEIVPIPTTEAELNNYAEEAYQAIIEKVRLYLCSLSI